MVGIRRMLSRKRTRRVGDVIPPGRECSRVEYCFRRSWCQQLRNHGDSLYMTGDSSLRSSLDLTHLSFWAQRRISPARLSSEADSSHFQDLSVITKGIFGNGTGIFTSS